LLRGSLDKVPIEENLNAGADDMEVDDDGTQRPKEVADWGVEPDFEILDDEDKEVSLALIETSLDKG
jgi:structural maintenance of chromosome 1